MNMPPDWVKRTRRWRVNRSHGIRLELRRRQWFDGIQRHDFRKYRAAVNRKWWEVRLDWRQPRALSWLSCTGELRMRKKCQFFQDVQRDASCHVYDDVRNRVNERCHSVREHCEDLWRDYRKFADENFPVEFALQFHQRWFEMYLSVTLLRRGIAVKCIKPRLRHPGYVR